MELRIDHRARNSRRLNLACADEADCGVVPEVRRLRRFPSSELSEVASLAMIASAEAVLRVDFERRVSDRRKDKVSREFRDIRRRRVV
jgi:hypothetical protein